MKIRIGTRGSRLALCQARLVEAAIRREEKDVETELVVLQTKGDRILDRPLSEIGDKGLFVSEFERALTEGRIDLAVHSAKDLPVRLAPGLTILAALPRGDVRDVLILPKGGKRPGRGEEFVLGTGSQRRILQARLAWEGVSCRLIRGNVETRIRKLEAGEYDGILLAKAGLDRLGIGPETAPELDFVPLEAERFLPAACQGIIVAEGREAFSMAAENGSPADIAFLADLCRRITSGETRLCFETERLVLAGLEADCSQAAAAWCRIRDGRLILDARYGERTCRFCGEASFGEGERLAASAARVLRGEMQR